MRNSQAITADRAADLEDERTDAEEAAAERRGGARRGAGRKKGGSKLTNGRVIYARVGKRLHTKLTRAAAAKSDSVSGIVRAALAERFGE